MFFWLSRVNVGYNESAFVMQKFCSSSGAEICATELVHIVKYGYILSTVYFSNM
jgi:hypothetical protein